MLVHRRAVRSIAREIGIAADGVVNAYREGRVTDEPAITGQIVGAIEERLRSHESGGIRWRALTLRSSSGKAAEEQRHGADLMGVLDIQLHDYQTKKGFLAQAKRAEPGIDFTTQEWNRLVQQCETMLDRTPAAFVLVYSKKSGIQVIPALSVKGYGGQDLFDLYHRTLSSFFESFLECFIGDGRLDNPDIRTLDNLPDFPIKNVIHLQATEAGS